MMEALLQLGAAVDQTNDNGDTALLMTALEDQLELVQALCARGAAKSFEGSAIHSEFAEELTPAILQWFQDTERWCSRLHHAAWLRESEVRQLLRDGADLHASDGSGGPTPLDVIQADPARARLASCQLVLEAAKPWSPATHCLFPDASRQYALQLAFLVFALRRDYHRHNIWWKLPWVDILLPLLVRRH